MSEELQQMQRLQLAGTLAGGIAHDLNNELTLVLGNIELALDQLPAGYSVCDSLENAKSAASRCAEMSRQLLVVSRDRNTSMTKIDVAESLIGARKMLEHIKPRNTRLTTESEIGLFVDGNTNLIQHALLELGINAFKAMETGGELELRAYRHEETVNVVVRDTGHGMTPLQQKRIFQPFYVSRSEKGLGRVQAIVRAHKGLVGVESRAGEGTIFMLNFPSWQVQEVEEVTK